MTRILLLAVLGTLFPAPVQAAPAAWQKARYEFTVDGPRQARLDLVISAKADSRPGFTAGLLVLRDARGHITWLDDQPLLADHNQPGSTARTSGPVVGDHDPCPPQIACTLANDGQPGDISESIVLSARAPLHATVYVVAEGVGLTVKVARRQGFTALRPRSSGFARLTTDASPTDRVDLLGHSYEVARGGALPGGPHGSIVIARPCDEQEPGSFTLGGGASSQQIDCPAAQATAASAEAATRWTLDGAAAGPSAIWTRLVVIER